MAGAKPRAPKDTPPSSQTPGDESASESLQSVGPRPKLDVLVPVSGRILNCGSRQLPLSQPQVMAVLNITPDSFSDGGELSST